MANASPRVWLDLCRVARRFTAALCAFGWLLLPPATSAEAPTDEQVLIDRQQRDLDMRLAAETQGCRTRFAVSDCLAEAQRRHRAASKPLRERQLRLDDAERERKAAVRRQTIADKARASAAPAASAPPTDLRLRKPHGPLAGRGRAAEASPSAPAASRPDAATLEAARIEAEGEARGAAARHQRDRDVQRDEDAADAAARVRAARARAEQAEAVRTRIAKRQAEQAARGRPAAAPLPVPSQMPLKAPPLPAGASATDARS